jgi:ubiquinone/menaquinone biosynthesis C-methylase UbiE
MSQGGFHFSTRVKDQELKVTSERVKQAYEALHARKAFQSVRGYYEWLLDLLRNAECGMRNSGSVIPQPEAPAPRLLDVGCGSGEMLRAAGAAGMSVAGIDISETGIAQAREKLPDADLKVASAEALPFTDASFDYVVSVGSLEHFMDPGKGLQEMKRVARPRARILLIVPNSRFLFAWVSHLRQAIAPGQSQPLERMASRKEWHELIEGNGLRVLQVHKDNKFFLPGVLLQGLGRGIGALIPRRLAYQLVFVAEPK